MHVGSKRHALQPETDWTEQASKLLYAGEHLRETIDVGDTVLLVTTHRVLVVRDDDEYAPVRTVHRPNLVAARTSYDGPRHLLPRLLQAGVFGVVSLIASVVLSGLFPEPTVDSPSEFAALDQVWAGMASLLAVLETAAFIGGVGLLILAGLGAAYYVVARTPATELEVAGGTPITLRTRLSPTQREALAAALSTTRNAQSDDPLTTA